MKKRRGTAKTTLDYESGCWNRLRLARSNEYTGTVVSVFFAIRWATVQKENWLLRRIFGITGCKT